MSTIGVPAPDRENASLRVRDKRDTTSLGGLGASGKPLQSTSLTRKLGLTMGESEHCQRSFGDISNRVGRVMTDSYSAGKKMHTGGECPDAVKMSTPHKVVEPASELEFIPEITETEDYFDVLPQDWRLTKKDISKLVDFWGAWKLPEISSCRIPDSPPRSPYLTMPMEEKPSSKLEPVLEEVYDLPPPWE